MAIRLLGPLTAYGGPLAPPAGQGAAGDADLAPRDRVVLSALALHPGAVLSAERLADALWGAEPPRSWTKIVQGCVVRLRAALGRDAIETTAGGYRLTLAGEDVDVRRFEGLVDRAASLAGRGEHDRAAAALTEALALWRGPALPDLAAWPPGAAESARLEELRLSAEEALVAAGLAQGADVTAAATALVHAEPLREHRWSLLARALYRAGRQADALAALRHARRVLREELGVDPGEELSTTERAVLRHDPALDVVEAPPAPRGTSPYKGLLVYEPGDAEWFHGREHDVAECLRVLHASRLLAVAGASGSGKSSLVRAGLVPALVASGRRVALMTPGPQPLSALAAAVGTLRAPGVLVVDQLEELFAATDGGVPAQFLDRVADVAGSGAAVVLVLRTDQMGGLAASARLARLVEQGLHLLAPMTPDQVRVAVEGPARQAGLRLEAGLVELLLRDVEGEAGPLPLLSHALLQTWERRDGRVLTVEGYEAAGGIRGAVAQSAETLYAALTPEQRVAARAVLLRLVTAGGDGDTVATRVPAESLLTSPQHRQVVDLLVRARLATADERGVVLAHEALVHAWPRLRSWLDEDVAGGRALRHLIVTAQDWQGRGRPDSELYRGARLQWVLEWRRREDPDLTDVEREFLAASAALASAEEATAASRLAEQRRQNRRLRSAVAATAAGLALALALGLVALDRGREARRAAASAQVERLVAEAAALRDTQRDLAALLAVEAHRLRADATTRAALFGVFTEDPGFVGYRRIASASGGTGLADGAVLEDGSTLLALGHDGIVRVLDLAEAGQVTELPAPGFDADGARMATSADGAVVAVAAWQGTRNRGGRATVAVHHVPTGEPVLPELRMVLDAGDVAVTPDGRWVAVSGDRDGRLLLLDLHSVDPAVARPALGTDRAVPGVTVLPAPAAAPDSGGVRHSAGLAFLPDGRLVAGSTLGTLRLIDPATGQVDGEMAGAPPLTTSHQVLVGPDDLLVSTGSAGVVRWDAASGRPAWATRLAGDRCASAVLAPLAGAVLCGDEYGGVSALDLDSGAVIDRRFDLQRGAVAALVPSPDGRTLVELSGTEPVLAQWRLDGEGPVSRVLPVAGSPTGFSVDGRLLLVGEPGPPPYGQSEWAVVERGTGKVVRRLQNLHLPTWTRQPTRVVGWDWDGNGHVVDVVDGARVERLNGGFGWPQLRAFVAADADVVLAGDPTFEGGTAGAWNLLTGQPAGPSRNRAGTVAALSPDGRIAATVHREEDLLELRDVATGEPVARRRGVTAAAISASGLVAAATPQGALVLLQADALDAAGRVVPGRVGAVEQLAFSRDGARLIARAADETVRLVDVAARQHLGGPVALPADAFAVALRPDGRELAVPGEHGVVLWNLEESRWVAAACEVAGRNLTREEWDRHLPGHPYRETCPASSSSESSGGSRHQRSTTSPATTMSTAPRTAASASTRRSRRGSIARSGSTSTACAP